ncbi:MULTISPECIES: ABC transporter ATP-binding protein [Leptolyngbya]|uniref:ABC transporter ATP-binding protein n=1 Tax=Leptolyngbya TaxID=47251 RepID=UPI0016888936|nr:ABC transporter ATP-binding protein [Leptolyngbya sp. FACHB-1624]MBD1854825.1 ABC transporter ATP-binding protein [Leptolyngbya sp. FACHB-1624]
MKQDATQNFKTTMPGISRILKQFAPQIGKQKSLLLMSFAGLMTEIFLHLLEPFPLKLIFDYILLPGTTTKPFPIPFLASLSPFLLLTVLTLGLIVITTLRAVASYFSIVGMALAASNILTEVRFNLYSHLQRLSLAYHHKNHSGDLITRVTSDIGRLREVTVMAVIPLIAHSLTLVGMIGVMLWMNWELALIAIALFPVFFFATFRLTRRIKGVMKKQRKREGEMAATVAESIGAIKVVQTLSLHEMLEESFSEHSSQSLQDSAKAQKIAAGLERLVELLVGFMTALVLWRGALLVYSKVLTPGDLLIFVNYIRIAFKPMRQVAKYIGLLAKATASGERVLDVLNEVPDISDTRGAITAPALRGAVQFDNVSFAYDNDDRGILRNMSFTVQPGQKVALVGSSGGGKSTIVSLLLRLYDPLEGCILIDGHDLRQYKLDSFRKQASVVLQDSVLFGTSIRDNIAYGYLSATDTAIESAAKLANAHDFILQLPQGYDTQLGERGSTLSGGQRQRIAIARAAIRNAPIVVLDEPTTGLDQENEHAVTEALNRLVEGKTAFWVSHNLKATKDADLILYVEKGAIVEQGTHDELMQIGGRYAAMYALQTAIDTSAVGV